MPRRNRLIAFVFILLSTLAVSPDQLSASAATELSGLPIEQIGQSVGWTKLLQYKRISRSKYIGDVVSARFYLSPRGMINPVAELKANISAFQNSMKRTSDNSLYACVFPARLEFIQKHFPTLKIKTPKCPDLEEWLGRIQADKVNIVYASQYIGNPASLLGHTFLRFYSSHNEKFNSNYSMLSYAVGFLAYPDPTDNKLNYMVKGIFGGYPGFYSMEPYYIKLGLYNNSESRDLFEQPLDLTTDEVQFMIKNLWELLFQSEFRYYFFSENCSYRVITLIEATRPEFNIIRESSGIVLPAETIRSLTQANATIKSTLFQPSIERKIAFRFENLTPEEKIDFIRLRNSKIESANSPSIAVLDTLVEDWTYKNYQAHAALNLTDLEKMESAFSARANLEQVSPVLPIEKIIAPSPPYYGHLPQLRSLVFGYQKIAAKASDSTLGLFYQFGNHSPWQTQKGYDRFSSIEFASAEASYGFHSQKITNWKFLFADVKSFTPIDDLNSKGSWQVLAQSDNSCAYCRSQDDGRFFVEFGYGPSLANDHFLFYSLPAVNLTFAESAHFFLAPGFDFGLRWRNSTIFIETNWVLFQFNDVQYQKIETVLASNSNRDLNWRAKLSWDFLSDRQINTKVTLFKDF